MVYKSWKKRLSVGALASAALLGGCMNRAATYRESSVSVGSGFSGAASTRFAARDAAYRQRGLLPPGIYEEPGITLDDRGIGGAGGFYTGVKVSESTNQRGSNSVDVLSQWMRVNAWDSSTRTNLPVRVSASPEGGSDGINAGQARPGG